MSVTGIGGAATHPLHSATTQPDALQPHGQPVGFQIYVQPQFGKLTSLLGRSTAATGGKLLVSARVRRWLPPAAVALGGKDDRNRNSMGGSSR